MSVWAAPVGEKGIAGKSSLWCLIFNQNRAKKNLDLYVGDVIRPPSCRWTHLDATCLSLENENIAAFSVTKWKALYFGKVKLRKSSL